MTKRAKPKCPACGMGTGYHTESCPLKPPPQQVIQNAQIATAEPWWKRAPIIIGVLAFVIQIAALIFAAGSIKADLDHLQQDMNDVKAWKQQLETYLRGR